MIKFYCMFGGLVLMLVSSLFIPEGYLHTAIFYFGVGMTVSSWFYPDEKPQRSPR